MEIKVNTELVKKEKGNLTIKLSDELINEISKNEELITLIGEYIINNN